MRNPVQQAGRCAALRAAAVLLAVTLATPALAADAEADPKPSVDEQILQILRDEGKISEEQYQDLKSQAQQEEAAQAGPAVSGAGAWDVGWKNGFYLNSPGGDMKLKAGGRIQIDGAVINFSDNLDRAVGGGADGTGVEFRRARLFVEGEIYEYGIFKAQYDFAGGQTAFKDVYVGLHDLPWVGRVRVGHQKEPFSIDQLTSARFTTFMERALTDMFAPERNTGIQADRTFADQRIYAALGVFRETDDFGNGFGNGSAYNVTARVTGLPIYENKGERLLHLGLQYSHQFRNNGTVRYSQRPESHLAKRVVDTMTIPNVDGVDLLDGEVAGVFGPLHFQGEGVLSYVARGVGMSDLRLWGAYGEVGYFLTGEHRGYKPSAGAFDRTSPNHNFNLREGTWGAWEVAGRLSHLDLDDRDVRGGTMTDLTAGLNWYLFPNLRLMTNYVYSWRHGEGNASIVEGRVSFDF